MSDEEEEDFDYENDESWYEDAMNALDSPANNHATIYTEEEIADLSEIDKTIIRYRNTLLQNGYEYIDLQNGDYINEVIGRSGVIHPIACSFVLAYKKERSYIIILQLASEDETIIHPIQLATMIFVNKHLGCYQFLEFIHLEQEIEEDQKMLNSININRELSYKEKPSLEFYKSDDMSMNKSYMEKIEKLDPLLFEFLNEYIIIELPSATIEKYFEVISDLGY